MCFTPLELLSFCFFGQQLMFWCNFDTLEGVNWEACEGRAREEGRQESRVTSILLPTPFYGTLQLHTSKQMQTQIDKILYLD